MNNSNIWIWNNNNVKICMRQCKYDVMAIYGVNVCGNGKRQTAEERHSELECERHIMTNSRKQ